MAEIAGRGTSPCACPHCHNIPAPGQTLCVVCRTSCAPVVGRTPSCGHCDRPAVWEAVTNGDHHDAYACGRHLHAILLGVTSDGWAKVDRLTAPARTTSPDGAMSDTNGHADA